MCIIQPALKLIGITIPDHDTSEQGWYNRPLQLARPSPLTGYPILVTIAAISFGMAKAALGYMDVPVVVTAIVEWVYCVPVALRCVLFNDDQ